MLPSGDSLMLVAGQSPMNRLVSDPAAYGGLTQIARKGGSEGLESAARAFESLLIGQLLEQLRSMSFGSGLFDSDQTRLYQDLYDQQLAAVLSEGEGWGIRKVLLRQLAPELSESQTAERVPSAVGVPERSPWLTGFKRRQVEAAVAEDETQPTEAMATQTTTTVGLSTAPALSTSGLDRINPQGHWLPRNAEEFVAYLKPYAEQAAEVLGMDTSVLLAQSALETGWGRYVPRHTDGRSSFNLFGIKADHSWQGDSVSVSTLEYRDGVARREQARFRAYATPAESFIDYVAFLKRNPRYSEALKSRTGEEFIYELQRAGYATDPHYASKILGIRDQILALGAATELQTQSETQVSAAQADSLAKA
ncbi:MAG: flagellar assembly peptidoglycan hydrolase FlgJ [Thermochromatium sp.]